MRRFYVWLLLALLAGSGLARAEPGPALWRIEQPGSRTYLLGSIHLLPPQTRWRSPAIDAAIAKADDLWLEVNPAETTDPAFTQYGIVHGVYGDGGSLAADLGPALQQDLDALLAGFGLPVGALDRMRPWLAAVSLTMLYARDRGFDPDAGVEKVLEQAFSANQRPINGLETPIAAISSLATLPVEAQKAMIADTMRQLSDISGLLEQMHDAWRDGDVARLETLLLADLKANQALYQSLIVARNRAWVEGIERIVASPGTHLIAVGAGHMLSEDGLPALLKARGLAVERVD